MKCYNLLQKFVLPALLGPLLGFVTISCDDDNDFWDAFIPETDKEATSVQVEGYVFYPALQAATDQNVAQLKVPAGFKVAKFAQDLGKPRILVTSANGHVYASDREAGIVMMLNDTNADGVADDKKTVATIKQVHGLHIYNNKLYMAAVKEVYVADMNADGTLSQPRMLISDLPDGGQHPNRTLAFGPDKKMYISVGSTCNACPESNPENATLLRADEDGSNRKVFAKGLRNTIGFGWHPETNELWGMDHGIDWLGDNEQKEELNQIKPGADYGWPYIYGEGKYNPGDRPKGTPLISSTCKKLRYPH